jgi:ferredoxin--NADP+ reductase
MFEVLAREMIVPNLHLLTLRAPGAVEHIKPGQFVIVRSDNDAERIPLSVADYDPEEGSLTLIFMEVGASTGKLASLEPGDSIPTVVGPLGKATEIENYGTVVCVGGCYGIGSMFPTVRALHQAGCEVITVLEGRSKFLMYWEEKLSRYSKRLFRLSRDGSTGYKGHVKQVREILEKHSLTPARIIANGCTFLIYRTSTDLALYNVPIIVSLNPIMIDGTGMCGVCRVSVDGKTMFACVDGPDFDGRLVDWKELLQRRKQYINEEAFLVHNSGCEGVKHD